MCCSCTAGLCQQMVSKLSSPVYAQCWPRTDGCLSSCICCLTQQTVLLHSFYLSLRRAHGIDGCRHLCALLCKLYRRERCEADPCNAALGGGHLTVCQLALKMPKQRRAGLELVHASAAAVASQRFADLVQSSGCQAALPRAEPWPWAAAPYPFYLSTTEFLEASMHIHWIHPGLRCCGRSCTPSLCPNAR
jgi:hypothetical protein